MLEAYYMAALQSLPHIGGKSLRRLLAAYGSAKTVWEMPPQDWADTIGLVPEKLTHIIQQRHAHHWESYLQRLEKGNMSIVTYKDDAYPALLKATYNPPAVLYYQGTLPGDDRLIAMVGSRKATPYGCNAAAFLARGLAAAHVGIVSGGARGIDTASHEGALSQHGYTLAVVANGLDITYPPENKRLYQRIVHEGGAVVSEFAPGMKPLADNFPARNRIINGLAQGVVVVEAAQRSGSLITADFALEEGRDVFAVPGSIFSSVSKGSNHLLQQGAIPACCAEDILKECGWFEENTGNGQGILKLTDIEQLVYERLSLDAPVRQDVLVEQLQLPPGKISHILLQLTLKGLIQDTGQAGFIRIIPTT